VDNFLKNKKSQKKFLRLFILLFSFEAGGGETPTYVPM